MHSLFKLSPAAQCLSEGECRMSYLVLARKYRPMFFKDVVGQEHVTQTLQNAIEQNRIANAYLFCGPRGVGKTTVARILSKALNCDEGVSVHPCNVCSSCVEVNESRSLDVLEIDGASNRGIDEVRNLRESLRYSPHPGKYRIYIIDEVHMLTNEAFNALLKTLEEPPPQVLFIFATTEPHKVPATILSRCQRFDFKRITTKRLMEQLRELCDKEDITIDEESIRLIANKGDGSMRDSQSILDQVIAFAGKTINADDTANMLGIIGQDLFFQVTDLIKTNNVQGGIDLVQEIFAEGYDFNEFLIGLAEHIRNLMVAKSTQRTDELNVSEEHGQRYLQESHDFELEDLLRLIKIASDTENLIRRSSNARLHLEVAIIKMIKLTKSVLLSELVEQFQDNKKKSHEPGAVVSSPPSPSVSHREKEPSVSPPPPFAASVEPQPDEEDTVTLTLSDIEKHWQTILERVKRSKVALGALLTEGWPTRLEEKNLELGFAGKNGFHITSIERQAAIIEEIIADVTGVRLRIRCIRVEPEQLQTVRKLPARVDKKAEFEKLEHENEIVREIVQQFDAEFIK